MRLNINKVTTAVAHFTAADTTDTSDLFDTIVKHSWDDWAEIPAAVTVQERYQLTPEEFLLFREMCLKIVDVALIIEPNAGASPTINMQRVSATFALLWSPNGNLQTARRLLDTPIEQVQFDGLSSEEAVVLRALLLTADEFVDLDEVPFLQDLKD